MSAQRIHYMTTEIEGKAVEIPFCQFGLNPTQQVACIGIDKQLVNEVQFGSEGEVKVDEYGYLSDQNFIFQSQLINSLRINGWDFENYGDPLILILTDKSESNGRSTLSSPGPAQT